MINEHIENVRAGKIKAEDYLKDALKKCRSIDDEYHYFNALCEEEAILQAKEIDKKVKLGKAGKLAGLLVSVKDNICVKGVESTAGSKILKGYKPLFDATVIKRLRTEDAIIIGKTSQDEFGFGSFNTNVGVDYRTPKNPHDKKRVTGGSSGGCAGITKKADFSHVSIGESTGGSIECPASFCGVIGFCPTYGKLSRYGLISYADSLDKIGIMSKKVSDIALVLDVISGFDEMDATSLKDELEIISAHKKSHNNHKIFKIGIIKESMDNIEPEITESMKKMIAELKENGNTVEEVSMPLTFKYGITAYYIIATSEASTNLSRFSGLRYGEESEPKNNSFNAYFKEVRSKNFGEEAKRRIMLGTFMRMAGYREAYYIKATKARTRIIEEYKKLFEKYDILISPTMPIVAPRFDETIKMSPLENYMMDILTIGPNLAGVPHASIPIAKKGKMPIGIMAIAGQREDKKLLEFMQVVENLARYEY